VPVSIAKVRMAKMVLKAKEDNLTQMFSIFQNMGQEVLEEVSGVALDLMDPVVSVVELGLLVPQDFAVEKIRKDKIYELTLLAL